MFLKLNRLPRYLKKLIVLFVDFLILWLALWSSFAMRYDTWWPENFVKYVEIWALAPVLTIPVLYALGLYKAVIRYLSPHFLIPILRSAVIAVLMFALVAIMTHIQIPRPLYIVYGVNVVLLMGGTRLLAKMYLPDVNVQDCNKRRIGLYGAGKAGTQIAHALLGSPEYRVMAFFDDNSEIQGWEILGVRVFSPDRMADIVAKYQLHEVVLCIPSATRCRRRELIERMAAMGVDVKILPGIPNIVSGKVRVDDIRQVEIEDVLGRDPVEPDAALIGKSITGKVVLVSGAGGSIGSELCRQILDRQPETLLLLEANEYALYNIERELRRRDSQGRVAIVPVLCSVQNGKRCQKIMEAHGVQSIFHAAAYKHVPIVEQNICEGIRNNIFGTLAFAQAAERAGVARFTLISTDKAVRPTSAMGATKRFAELILQGMHESGSKTVFSMVRFGNVLGSSGSVIPLFREQIRQGGPVTVTHEEMTRYFMTIPEAAQLVVQASAMASGGDVFVLDMGEPVRIYDLAAKMIHLSGLSVIDPDTGRGDVEIRITGVRPGEKLYEELLIGDNALATDHPRISRAMEESIDWKRVDAFLKEFEPALDNQDAESARRILLRGVRGFRPADATHFDAATRRQEVVEVLDQAS
ncbi:polysaccharide biosynthesis protein [Acanthopleuribacter pedis]|uniref:Polysaccharide biosynthesis protein n=1 Tax=Acanthopleuribacter pedis TaxID=442870 RepID=A0A8J7U517_9BACT|nr:nucleoside-diphosphate sugar epimerase/dehydratase [Acanthopleuribacter pedis]MBO1322053.1 polysaccharide biosynthesis protein [Acanthopleuribacter pedis]